MFFIQIDLLVILKYNKHGLMFASEARNSFQVGPSIGSVLALPWNISPGWNWCIVTATLDTHTIMLLTLVKYKDEFKFGPYTL
jgi:hypothetical protein